VSTNLELVQERKKLLSLQNQIIKIHKEIQILGSTVQVKGVIHTFFQRKILQFHIHVKISFIFLFKDPKRLKETVSTFCKKVKVLIINKKIVK